MNKKGMLGNLGALGVGIATLTIVLVVAFLVVADTQTQLKTVQNRPAMVAENGTTAYNATVQLQSAAATIPGWVPLIVLVAIGGLIIALVSKFGR